jgi:Flp pilus assembly protein TadG
MTATLRWMLRNVSELSRDTRGVTAAIMAMSMATLVGLAGLGVETGLWFSEKRHYQSAVDAAAMSAAFQLASKIPNLKCNGKASNPSGYMTSVLKIATTAATANGYGGPTAVSGTLPTTSATEALYVNNPPTIGSFSPADCAVEAVIYEPKNALLAAVSLGSGSKVTIAARAVALINFNFGGGACALALNTGAAPSGNGGNAGISVSGGGSATVTNPNLNDPNCTVASNSSDSCAISTNGSPIVDVNDFYAVGGDCVGSNTTFSSAGNQIPVSGGDPVPDPFASDFTNSSTGGMPTGSGCPGAVDVKNPSNATIQPGTYKSIQLTSGGPYTFASGVYYICSNSNGNNAGEFLVNSSVTVSTDTNGATFVVQGQISISGSTGTNGLSAPGTGATYPGILFYQPGTSSSLQQDSIGGNATLTLNGAIYLPGGNLTMNGTPSSAQGCLEVVAYTIGFSGTSQLSNTGCTATGGPGDINITNVTLAY